METSHDVAATILAQLGGNHFCAMVGARSILFSADTLRFRIMRNVHGITCVDVRLDPSDTYTMTFYGRGYRVVATRDDVYAEDLRRIFEDQTGLRTSL